MFSSTSKVDIFPVFVPPVAGVHKQIPIVSVGPNVDGLITKSDPLLELILWLAVPPAPEYIAPGIAVYH